MITPIPVKRRILCRKKKPKLKKKSKETIPKNSKLSQSNMRINISQASYKNFKALVASQGITIKQGVAEAIKLYIKLSKKKEQNKHGKPECN